MRRSILLLPAVLAAAALTGPSANAAADAGLRISGTQCRTGERVAYTCTMGKKVMSVCVTRGRMVAYRYGPLGKPEMQIASTGQDGKAHRRDVMLAQGGHQTHLRFSNGGYEYLVYSGDTGPNFDPPNVRSSGLVVMRGGEDVSTKDCPRNGDLQRIRYDDIEFIAEELDETYDTER